MDILQDLRFAARTAFANRTFSLAALLSIAIGVGANTAIFSVVSALLLRPLPYADPDRLVIVWNRSPGLGITEDWFSTAQYFDVRRGHTGFEQLAIAIGGNENLTGDGGEPERIGAIRMSSNLLPMLGVRPALGRLLAAGDDLPGGPASAVLGHGTWIRRYGGNPSIVGRPLVINGQPYRVVGVLPESFSLPREVLPTLNGAEDAEIVLPLPLDEEDARIRTREDYNIIGKLKSGIEVAQAQAEMDGITARLRREHPDVYPPNGGLTFGIVPLQEQVVGNVRQTLVVLAGAVGLVLLIACANVANLLLSRAVARQKEIAVRAALGAGRARIVQQLLTESVLIACVGGALGLGLAWLSVEAMRALGESSVPRLREIAMDGRVLLFTLAISAAAGMLFGLAPALRLVQPDLHHHLKDAGRGSSGASAIWGRGRNMRRLLVVAELALSVVLLAGAGLLIRSFVRLQNVSPGFDASNVLTFELTMSGRKYSDAGVALETYRQLWERLARLPGVTASGGVSALPLSQMFSWGPITVEGRTPPAGEEFINADMRMVGGDYLRAMRIPLLEGRYFTQHDTRTNPRVVIVDEHMAAQLWPGTSPLGRRIRIGGAAATTPWLTVVGVVGRIKQYTLDGDSRIAMYLAQTQFPARAMNVVLRGAGDPAALASAARGQVRELDPDLPIYNVRTMEQRISASLATRRFTMLLLALFAALALGLAALGIYGVMTYLVSQGTRELGIRIALGATPAGIVMLVVRQGLGVAAVGIAAGLAAAFPITRLLQSLLFQVGSADPMTFVTIPVVLGGVALLASYVPARRAARIDPVVSLSAD